MQSTTFALNSTKQCQYKPRQNHNQTRGSVNGTTTKAIKPSIQGEGIWPDSV
jgi:hypothetical protein